MLSALNLPWSNVTMHKLPKKSWCKHRSMSATLSQCSHMKSMPSKRFLKFRPWEQSRPWQCFFSEFPWMPWSDWKPGGHSLHWTVTLSLLRVSDVCLQMSNDSKNCVNIILNEITVPQRTVRSLFSGRFLTPQKSWINWIENREPSAFFLSIQKLGKSAPITNS